jgi:hypothetical protein
MSKNSSQGRRQASTHYHDAARQHQQAAHLEKRVAPNEPRNAQKARTSSGSRRSGAKTKR